MTERFPEDGGFIGKSGCSHPNHRHSDTVERLLSATNPERISLRDANAAFNEGFYVDNPDGDRVGFGWNLKGYLDNHGGVEPARRKESLLFAVDAVRTTRPLASERTEGRVEYAKRYGNRSVLVVAEAGEISDVVTFYLPRKVKGE